MTTFPLKNSLQVMLTRIAQPVLGMLLLASLASTSVSADFPNIVIILADDLG